MFGLFLLFLDTYEAAALREVALFISNSAGETDISMDKDIDDDNNSSKYLTSNYYKLYKIFRKLISHIKSGKNYIAE